MSQMKEQYVHIGVHEKYNSKELICNYWQFLDEVSRKELESQLNEDYSDSDDNYGDYDSYDEMSPKTSG